VKETQISGFIPEDVKQDLERFVRARGLKKNFVLEQALRHHLQALKELPEEFIIPPTIVVTRKSFEEILKTKGRHAKPTAALRKLMRGQAMD
jgi:hypothetical protein